MIFQWLNDLTRGVGAWAAAAFLGLVPALSEFLPISAPGLQVPGVLQAQRLSPP